MICNFCGTQLTEDAVKCPNCGKDVCSDNFQQSEQKPKYGLGWAHFLAYFGLWAGALLNAFSAIAMFTGSVYGGLAERVYNIYPSLKSVDRFYAVCLFVFVVLAVITAISIIKLKKKAGVLVCSMYLASALVGVIYIVSTTAILGMSTLNPTTAASIGVSVIMFFVNIVYFNHRKDIFVN